MIDLLTLFEKATASELFNARWYMEKYQLYFENEVDAFADFLRKSRHSWVDPSPLFSSRNYFKKHLDELIGGNMPPLQHYLLYATQTLAPSHSEPNWMPNRPITAATPFSKKANYAITAHIFYDDYVDKLFNSLSGFAPNIDLFIAVPTEEIGQDVQQAANRNTKINRLDVRVVPNRGRNFGPLLVEFGTALLSYDFFCHLHSKKSLFTGSSQENWGDYLYEYLLQDKQILNRALSIFEESTCYGIYFPTAFSRSLPRWATHVLQNKGSMQVCRDLIGLPAASPSFLPYPVGGMFWARSEALRPLLVRNWSYDDFPAEPIANDGTILHAIERILVEVVEHQGYKHFAYHPESGCFTSETGHLTEEYVNTHGDLGYVMNCSTYRVISFDIFDTLLYRSSSYPDQAKESMPGLLGLSISGQEFRQLRNKTEFELRRLSGFQGDVIIQDVYRKLRLSLAFDASAEKAAELEFQADFETYRPKSEMLDLLHQAYRNGKTIYIVTDTYYSREQIQIVLGWLEVPDDCMLFVSSHEGMRKDNGSLWQYIKKVLQQADINPLHEFIHIGDNVVSDSQIPGDYGLGNYHILNPFDKWSIRSRPHIAEHELADQALRHKFGPLIAQVGRSPFL